MTLKYTSNCFNLYVPFACNTYTVLVSSHSSKFYIKYKILAHSIVRWTTKTMIMQLWKLNFLSITKWYCKLLYFFLFFLVMDENWILTIINAQFTIDIEIKNSVLHFKLEFHILLSTLKIVNSGYLKKKQY